MDLEKLEWLKEPTLKLLSFLTQLPFLKLFILLLVGGIFWRLPHIMECWKHFLDYRHKRRNSENKFALEQKKLDQEVTRRIIRSKGRR